MKVECLTWIPIIINKIPKKNIGLFPIGSPLNQPIVRYKLIYIPEIKFDNPPIWGKPRIYSIPQIEPIIASVNWTKSVIITAFSPPKTE